MRYACMSVQPSLFLLNNKLIDPIRIHSRRRRRAAKRHGSPKKFTKSIAVDILQPHRPECFRDIARPSIQANELEVTKNETHDVPRSYPSRDLGRRDRANAGPGY